MQAGKIVDWEKLELRLELLGNLNSSSKAVRGTIKGALRTQFTEDTNKLVDGIRLTVQSLTGENAFSQYRLQIPPLGIDEKESNHRWNEKLCTNLILENLKVYWNNYSEWELHYDNILWIIGQNIKKSFPKGKITGSHLAPSGIPLLGIPVELSAQTNLFPEQALGFGRDGFDHEANIQCKTEGGWRFFTQGEWHTLPVSCQAKEGINATNTFSGSVKATTHSMYKEGKAEKHESHTAPDGQPAIKPIVFSKTKIEKEFSSSKTSLILLPNLEKGVERLSSDYAALIFRGGFPETYCLKEEADSFDFYSKMLHPTKLNPKKKGTCNAIHSAKPAMVGKVKKGTHPIEEPMKFMTEAPYRFQKYTWKVQDLHIETIEEGLFPLADGKEYGPKPDYIFTKERWVKQQSSSEYFPILKKDHSEEDTDQEILDFLNHEQELPKYINTIAHPHWSYFYYFPKANKKPLWKINNQSIKIEDYWLPLKCQYLDHPNLKDTEKSKTRTKLISSQLAFGFMGEELKSSIGIPTSWWGIHRFHTKKMKAPSQITLTPESKESWKLENGTLHFDQKIILKPKAKKIYLELDLSSFQSPPFFYPICSDKVEITWENNNIKNCQVYRVSALGDKQLLCTKSGIQSIKPSSDASYAGSWAQDFGTKTIKDLGNDTSNKGQSKKIISSAESNVYFGLLTGRSAKILRYEIEVKNLNDTVELNYPIFYSSQKNCCTFYENSKIASVVFENGPLLRWGQWKWFNKTNLLSAPYMPSMDKLNSSALDLFCYERLIFQGKNPTKNLLQEIHQVYDKTECNDLQDAEEDTSSFLISLRKKLIGIHTNSLAEVPPLACFPQKGRNHALKRTQPWSQKSYSLAIEPNFYICPGKDALELINQQDSKKISTQKSAKKLKGWSIVTHNQPASDQILERCAILYQNKKIAEASPWNGYSAIISFDETQQSWPWHLISKLNQYHKVSCLNKNLIYQNRLLYNLQHPIDFMTTLTKDNLCLGGRIAEDLKGKLYLIYAIQELDKNVKVYEVFSNDHGKTWNSPNIMFEKGKYPTLYCAEDGTIIRAAFIESNEDNGSGNIMMNIQFPGEKTPSEDFWIQDNQGKKILFKNDSFHIIRAKDSTAGWILIATHKSETEPSEWISYNECQSWHPLENKQLLTENNKK